MRYLIVTKLEYPATVSLKVKGLKPSEIEAMSAILTSRKAKFTAANKDFFEVDLQGVEMLNLLASEQFGYKVCCQSMAMEHSDLGGRSFQIEKIVWTMGKEE